MAIVGVGKIACIEHAPAIRGNSDFLLVATVDKEGASIEAVAAYRNLDDLLTHEREFDAVALCTPPQSRHALAAAIVSAGKHVLLEKPPCATLSQAAALEQLARTKGVAMLATWHSRGAAGVARAREWLRERQIRHVSIVWREDVRVWHPRQRWIWEAGGLGVFDAGINSLAIVTHILPSSIYLNSATLVFPQNCDAPIAAELQLAGIDGTSIDVDLDWRHTGEQTWDITIETDAGTAKLTRGGSYLSLPTGETVSPQRANHGLYYREVYVEFARVVRNRSVEVDVAPMRIVADAFLAGHRQLTEAFHD